MTLSKNEIADQPDISRRRRLIEDRDLTAEQLDNKYNPHGDGEHPVLTRVDWRMAVANENTISGYWDWLAGEAERLGYAG